MKKLSIVFVVLAAITALPAVAHAADGFVPPGPGKFEMVSGYLIWMSDKAEVGNSAFQWKPGMDPSQYKDQTIIHTYRQTLGQNASPDISGQQVDNSSKAQIIQTASDNSASGTSGSAQ
jgi:hypothetical protein